MPIHGTPPEQDFFASFTADTARSNALRQQKKLENTIYHVYNAFQCSCGVVENSYIGRAIKTPMGLEFLPPGTSTNLPVSPDIIYLPSMISRCSTCFPTVIKKKLLALLSHDYPDDIILKNIRQFLSSLSH